MSKFKQLASYARKNVRFRNVYFWLAIAGVVFLVLTDLGLLGISEDRFQEYVELISAAMIISGIWVDPTTPGFTDGKKQD